MQDRISINTEEREKPVKSNHSTYDILKSMGEKKPECCFAASVGGILSGAVSTKVIPITAGVEVTKALILRAAVTFGMGAFCGLFTCAICAVAPCICNHSKQEIDNKEGANENTPLISDLPPTPKVMKA